VEARETKIRAEATKVGWIALTDQLKLKVDHRKRPTEPAAWHPAYYMPGRPSTPLMFHVLSRLVSTSEIIAVLSVNSAGSVMAQSLTLPTVFWFFCSVLGINLAKPVRHRGRPGEMTHNL
jgi:hypothetical protein